MSSIPGKVRIAFLGALVVAGLLVPASSASAQTLNGLWAPLTPPGRRSTAACDERRGFGSVCIAATSPAEIKLGNTTSTTGATNLQIAGVADDGGRGTAHSAGRARSSRSPWNVPAACSA